jgi:uncharacterized membrane protein
MTNGSKRRLSGYLNIMDEVFGLSLGLGTFSLSSTALVGIPEFMNAAFFFAVVYAFISMAWASYSQFFDEYPMYDNLFLGMNFGFLFSIALVPFILRLMFYEGITLRQNALQVFAANLAVIYVVLAIMVQKYLSQHRSSISINQRKHLHVTRNSHLMVAFMFLTDIFLYRKTVVAALTERSLFWLLIFLIPSVYTLLASRSFEADRRPVASSGEEEGDTISKCCRRVTKAMLGVCLGLTVFSLTDFPLSNPFDMFVAVMWFLNNFFIVFILIIFTSMFLGTEEPMDGLSVALSLIANFFLALLALLLQAGLLFIKGQTVSEILNLVPLNLACATACLGIIGIRFTSKFRGKFSIKEFDHTRSEVLNLTITAPFLVLFTLFKPQIMDALSNFALRFLPATSLPTLLTIIELNMGWIGLLGSMLLVSPIGHIIFRIQEGHWSSHKF